MTTAMSKAELECFMAQMPIEPMIVYRRGADLDFNPVAIAVTGEFKDPTSGIQTIDGVEVERTTATIYLWPHTFAPVPVGNVPKEHDIVQVADGSLWQIKSVTKRIRQVRWHCQCEEWCGEIPSPPGP